jgi:hypothetical protein
MQEWSDQASYLTFDLPLAGTFEFSVDTYRGGMGDGVAGTGASPLARVELLRINTTATTMDIACLRQ